ncbi:MAG: HU family DNA-binding protein [Azoarcus sp.]|jgi:predicted histone-like DNA-binding protein|nr:HU family DNA-binding protein [Azoarcus sp.]
MAIDLKKLSRRNPRDLSQSKWYLIPVASGTVTLKELAREIEKRSAMTYADVSSVLISLTELLARNVKAGRIVRLGEFGSFRVSVSSEGEETPEALTARHVKGARILFMPSADLKAELRTASYTIAS